MMSRLIAAALVLISVPGFAAPRIVTGAHPSPREQYAADSLRKATAQLPGSESIYLAQRSDAVLARFDKQLAPLPAGVAEAFSIRRIGNSIVVAGSDASGVLYGALELIDELKQEHKLPSTIHVDDHPKLKLRGVALGMQKPEITYDGAEYDYRYTPEDFPFFYDKAYWTKYLDLVVKERYNALFLWNGHPFTSVLKLPKYPEAQELPNEQLEKNIEMYRWLTSEADRRGIWVLQGFYNIHLSHPFAKAHGIPNHLSAPTPLASEYTRYCISEFIRNYPSVGLMMTLGEAMGPHYGPEWLTKTIIPGVKDGVEQLSKEVGHPVPEPPIVVRAHATDIREVMAEAKPLYSNIDTMSKWNGESLTWTDVRGPILDQFNHLVSISNLHVANIHILSNLEPFRWGDPDFVRESVLSFERIGIKGVHVYPLRYWDWPVAADKTSPQPEQTDRDWVWYESWGRYAWDPDRDPKAEYAYWTARFAERFGSKEAAEHLLKAYELSGICAPKLLPRIGITEGNRQVLSLGMTMPQLIDDTRFNPAQTLWTGDAPEGERLVDYVAKEFKHQPHVGETPIGVADEVAESSGKAVVEAQAAASGITQNRAEYERVVTDMRAIHELMLFYKAKTHAAEQVMLFGHDRDLAHLDQAEKLLTESVEHFRLLAQLTENTYRDAAAMQTSQRQIPVRGGPSTKHWRDVLPVYQKELATYHERLQLLRQAKSGNATAAQSEKPTERLPQVDFTLSAGSGETFNVAEGQGLLAEKSDLSIAKIAPELNGMKGIRISPGKARPIHFNLSKDAQILVGFLKPNSRQSTNLANETEQWNLLLPNAVTSTAKANSQMSVWTKSFPAGENDLDLGKGAYVVLGFIPDGYHVTPHFDLSAIAAGGQTNLDWLFE